MDKVDVLLVNNNVAIIKKDNDLHYLHFSMLNSNFVIILFIIAIYNNVVVKFPTNIKFWNDFIYFIKTQNKKINKKIYFENNIDVNIIDEPVLFYSGGKDSLYSYYVINNKDIKLFKLYDVTNYREPIYFPNKNIIKAFTNLRDLLYKLNSKEIFYTINLILPIISGYRINYIGLSELEIKEHKRLNFVDFNELKAFLKKNNIIYDSPIFNYKTTDIIKNLRKINTNYLSKCSDENDLYCYSCTECLYLYLEGANINEHKFDRDKMDKIINKAGGIDKLIKTQKDFNPVYKLLLELYEKYY